MSIYGVISGPYFPVFGLNTGKYGSEKCPYLGTFYAVILIVDGKHFFVYWEVWYALFQS